jgi:hypothetical protein
MERTQRRGGWAEGAAAARRTRGFSSVGREADIGARMEGLMLMSGVERGRVMSALRAMRRARHGRGAGYDPARHAALLRLLKKTAPPERTAQPKCLKTK